MPSLSKSQELVGRGIRKFKMLLLVRGRIGGGPRGCMMALYYLSSTCLFFKKYEESQAWKDQMMEPSSEL